MKDYELLRKQADMMEMAEKYGVSHWTELVKYYDKILFDFRKTPPASDADKPLDSNGRNYKFALGVVEGRPVFQGDTLYSLLNGREYQIRIMPNDVANFSWNPPAPKTITIELRTEYARQLSCFTSRDFPGLAELADACQKELEGLK